MEGLSQVAHVLENLPPFLGDRIGVLISNVGAVRYHRTSDDQLMGQAGELVEQFFRSEPPTDGSEPDWKKLFRDTGQMILAIGAIHHRGLDGTFKEYLDEHDIGRVG